MKASLLTFVTIVMCATGLHAQMEDFASTDFRKADSIAQLYPKHSLLDLRSLADKLTKPLTTEQEKFRAIYKWICLNIDNDYILFRKNKHKRERLKDPAELKKWNQEFSGIVFETLRKKHKTVCTGYAVLVKDLSYHAGLSAVVIDGYGRTAQANIGGPGIPNHSWNAIQLNNKWYLCDATWSSGAMDTEKAMFVRKYDDSYFLPDPALFARKHYPLDSSWMLLEKKPTLEMFLNGPLIYSSAFQYEIDRLLPDTFNLLVGKGESVSFRFTKRNNTIIDSVELQLMENNTTRSAYPKIYQDANGFYCIDHTFTTKGTHTVHVLLNHSYIFTYAVKVTK